MNRLLARLFAERRNRGHTDLKAVETAMRTALHQAGSAALTELLQYEAPAPDQHQLPCPCGHHAQYRGCVLNPCLRWLARRRFRVPITGVRSAIKDSFPPMWNWTS